MNNDQADQLRIQIAVLDAKVDTFKDDLPGEINQLSDTVAKLYRHMEGRFDAVDQRFDAMDRRFDQIVTMLDADAKRREIDEHERLAMGAQLDRHDAWIGTAAGKLGIRYGQGT